ncbi:hypothetical protein CTZ27_11925 [Streptomyces griseocarneus]|nr:hypothetical protein CTZ27_11925 [Streptomyces griseocarneus]
MHPLLLISHRASLGDRFQGLYPGRLRQQFEGVTWKFRSGAQWREMPDRFGAWPTVHIRFRRAGRRGLSGLCQRG